MKIEEITEKFKNASIVDKFIYINLAVFTLTFVIEAYSYLSNNHYNFMIDYFALPSSISKFIYKPYTFITYGFLHAGFLHILFNLIYLYFLGNLFVEFLSAKKFVVYYIVGTISGGLFFVLSYAYFPVFKNSNGVLLGASAGISALLVGLATYMPNYEINLRFIGYVKLWILTLIFVVLSIAFIPNGNAGGEISHIGGAIIGYILTRYYANNFNFEKRSYKSKSNLKTVYKAKEKSNDFGQSIHQKKIIKQRKIDEILDKISKSGYDSLSKKERDFLADSSKE